MKVRIQAQKESWMFRLLVQDQVQDRGSGVDVDPILDPRSNAKSGVNPISDVGSDTTTDDP